MGPSYTDEEWQVQTAAYYEYEYLLPQGSTRSLVQYEYCTRPCLGPLWRLPWQRLGSVLGPGDELMMLTTSTRTARTPARRFTP